MNTQMSVSQTRGARIRNIMTAPIRKLYSAVAAGAAGLMVTAPTLCTMDPTKLDMDKIFTGMVGVITKIALYVGALLAVAGLFSLIMAYKDDNADGQTRAVRLIVIGIILIGFKTVLALIGLK